MAGLRLKMTVSATATTVSWNRHPPEFTLGQSTQDFGESRVLQVPSDGETVYYECWKYDDSEEIR
jgi:hypothetical protein